MFEPIRARVLRLLRVPHDPDPPAGAPGSARVFRAARNFYKFRLFRWSLGQVGALIGILVSLNFLDQLQSNVDEVVRTGVKQATGASWPPPGPAPRVGDRADLEPAGAASRQPAVRSPQDRSRNPVQLVADRWPPWGFPVLTILEWAGVLLYVIQIPITYAIIRLDYELRWYIVTDRSLRIRAGVASVQETTMSFANVQQVAVSQGPLQRLLGIADLRVQSAGGGGGDQEHGEGESLHTGIFHGVDNASQIRDLILERLRAFREAGLGDPDDPQAGPRSRRIAPPLLLPDSTRISPLAAAREVLQEARALRQILQ